METIDKMTVLPDGGVHGAGPAVAPNDVETENNRVLCAEPAYERPLLHLPGEIRNRIYKFALTADDNKLHIKPSGSNSKDVRISLHLPDNQNIEFNQLKFVCRQLYNETAGLEAKFNTVYFCAPRPAAVFVHFVATCSTKKAAWFPSVMLIESNTKSTWPPIAESPNILRELAKYCRLNPFSTVKYIPFSFNGAKNLLHFYTVGLWISIAFRHKKVPSYDSVHDQMVRSVQCTAGSWVDAAFVAELNIPNLRFWPFGLSNFEKAAEELGLNQIWIQYTEEWMKNGI